MSAAYTVWKYELLVIDVQKVSMPEGARILHIGIQTENQGRDRHITMWAWVDRFAPERDRVFAVVGTGNPAPTPEEATYIGSVFDRPFVWHVFEAKI